MPHPSRRSFLNWLQEAQYEVECRILQLETVRPARTWQAAYVSERVSTFLTAHQHNIGYAVPYHQKLHKSQVFTIG